MEIEFIFLIIVFILIKTILIRNKEIKYFSIENSVFFGFILFFTFPILFVNDLPSLYEVVVILGFITFLITRNLTKKIFKKISELNLFKLGNSITLYNIAFYFCITFLVIKLVLLVGGGLNRIYDIWVKNIPVKVALQETSNVYYSIGSKTLFLSEIFSRIFKYWFLGFWGVIFLKNRNFSYFLWFMFFFVNLTNYMGRFGFLSMLSFPILCLLISKANEINTKKFIFLISGMVLLMLFFIPNYHYFRKGNLSKILSFHFSEYAEIIKLSTSTPIHNATLLIKNELHDNWEEYFKILIIKPIPYILWPSKPKVNFNYDTTYLVYKKQIGPDQPISTFSMYGEGYYYFGDLGLLVTMILFGFFSQMFELFLLNKNPLFFSSYAFLFINSGFYIFDNFLDYYGYILNNFLSLLILLILLKILLRKKS